MREDDVLTVATDFHMKSNSDIPVLSVMRNKDKSFEIVNAIIGDVAVELYKILVNDKVAVEKFKKYLSEVRNV